MKLHLSKLSLFSVVLALTGTGTFLACGKEKERCEEPLAVYEEPVCASRATLVGEVSVDSVSWGELFQQISDEAQAGQNAGSVELTALLSEQLEQTRSLTAQSSAHGKDGPEGVGSGCYYYNIRYTSTDQNGDCIILSELVALPYNAEEERKPYLMPENLIIGCHCTITDDSQRPSFNRSLATDVGLMSLHAGVMGRDMVVIPDYQGYGASVGYPHPYCVQDLSARQVVDGVMAAMKFAASLGVELKEDYKSVAVGYSQGGAVALAVQRYLVENKLDEELHFAGSVCGGGPYSLSSTFGSYIETDKVFMPVACVLVIKGMSDAAKSMLQDGFRPKYELSDFFTEKFLKSGVTDMIDAKNMTSAAIDDSLLKYSMNNNNGFVMKALAKDGNYYDYTPENSFMAWYGSDSPMGLYCECSELLHQDLIDAFTGKDSNKEIPQKYKDLFAALDENQITAGWTEKYPTYYFHSANDEVVPYSNFEHVMAHDRENELVKGFSFESATSKGHSSAGTHFFLYYERTFVNEIISGSYKQRSRLQTLE